MAFEILNNKKYDILDPLVEDIHTKCIKMDNEEKRALVGRFQRVINSFINKMKEADSLFNSIYNRTGYTGSYFEGVRVREATEFDLNLVLKPKLKIATDTVRAIPGFISLTVKDAPESLPKHYKNWCKFDQVGTLVLDPSAVSSWLQSVVQKTMSLIHAYSTNLLEDCMVYLYKSGPAWTLVINSDKEPVKRICVDLVPVLEFSYLQWPLSQAKSGYYVDTWFTVPKPPRYGYPFNWRLSFPKQEAEMLRGKEHLKYTLRLLKRVRDQFEFKLIASYYITTLFLWEVKNQNTKIWNTRRGRLFVYMLVRLMDALEAGNIPFFWHEECNLIGHIPSNTLDNFCRRVKRFLNCVDRYIDTYNHDQLKKFISESLSTPEEQMEDQEAEEQQRASERSCTIL